LNPHAKRASFARRSLAAGVPASVLVGNIFAAASSTRFANKSLFMIDYFELTLTESYRES
jgi:hypothetical protein